MVTRGRQFDSGNEKPKNEKVVNLDTGSTVFPGYVDWQPSRDDGNQSRIDKVKAKLEAGTISQEEHDTQIAKLSNQGRPVVQPPIVDDPNNPEVPKEERERAIRVSKNRTAGGTSTGTFIGNRVTPRVDVGAKGKAKAEKSERRKQKRRDLNQGLIDQAGRDLEAGNITQEEHDTQVAIYNARLAKIKSPQTRTTAAQRVVSKRKRKTERAQEASEAGSINQSKRETKRIREAARVLGYRTHTTIHGTHIKDNEGNLVSFFPSKQGLAQKASGIDVPFDAIEDEDGKFVADAPDQSYIDQTDHAASLLEAAHYGAMQRLSTARPVNTAESTGDTKEQALGRKIIKTEGQRADRELAAGLTKLGTQFLQNTHVIHHPTEGAILLDKDGNLLSHKANSDNFAIARADMSPERASELEGLAKGVMSQDANIPLHLKHFDDYQTNKQTLKILAAEHANREILKAGHTVYPEHFPMRKKKVDGKVVMDSNGKPLLERAHQPVGITITTEKGQKVKEMPDYALNNYLNHYVSLSNPTGTKQSSFNSKTRQLAYPRGAAIRDLVIAAGAAKSVMLGGSRKPQRFQSTTQLKDEAGAKLFRPCQNPSCESGKNAYEGKASDTTINKHCPECTQPLAPAMKEAPIATGGLDFRVDIMNDMVFGPRGWLPQEHSHVNDTRYTAQIKEAVPAPPSKNARKKTHEVADKITAEVAPDSVEAQRNALVDQAGPQQIPKCKVAYCGKRHRDANGNPTTHEMDKLTPQQAQQIIARGVVPQEDKFEETQEPKA